MIRPEIQAGPLPRPGCDRFKERGLQQAVFMVTFFGPRVGKQDPEFGEGGAGRQRIDQLPGFRLDKVAVSELGPLGLALRPPDPVTDQVHPEAETLGIFRRVAGQKMAVSRADLQRDGGSSGDERGERSAQCSLSLRDACEEFGFGSHASL